MLCDRVLGNVDSDAPGHYTGRERDVLELSWRECARRAVRGRTAGGRRIGVLLPRGEHLRHGDVIADGDAMGLVVVSVLPCEVWVAEFADVVTESGERSEERRVGKECCTPCRSRWSPYH